MKSAQGPRIEEVQIPTQLGGMGALFYQLGRFLGPGPVHGGIPCRRIGQRRTLDTAIRQFETSGLCDAPWMPAEPIFARPHESRGKRQETHRRPTSQPVSPRPISINYFRLVLAGDLAAASAKFGRLADQQSHLGPLIAIETTENATDATAYDKAIRTSI